VLPDNQQEKEPCEVMFIRSDSLVDMNKKLSTKMTIKNQSGLCDEYYPPYKIFVDTTDLLSKVKVNNIAGSNDIEKENDTRVYIAIAIRVYRGNLGHLISMLLSLKAMSNEAPVRLSILITCTEYESLDNIYDLLVESKHLFYGIEVYFLDFPKWIYTKYEGFLGKICTAKYRDFILSIKNQNDYNRHCTVNSPLHYILSDLSLIFTLQYLPMVTWYMITNADNSYSPLLFPHLLEREVLCNSSFDVILFSFLLKGAPLVVSPHREHVDLGSVMLSTNFLKMHNLTFLSALPIRSSPWDYHDNDGHMVERVVEINGTIYTIDELLFYQN
jgi:hypothetical protein